MSCHVGTLDVYSASSTKSGRCVGTSKLKSYELLGTKVYCIQFEISVTTVNRQKLFSKATIRGVKRIVVEQCK